MKNVALILFLFISIATITSGQRDSICGSQVVLKIKLLEDTTYYKKIINYENRLDSISNLSKGNDAEYIIPVVFHIVYKNLTELGMVPDTIIYETLHNLNLLFAGKSKVGMEGFGDELKANCRITFRLASIDTYGNQTIGIERKFTTIQKFTTPKNAFDVTYNYNDIKFNSTGGLNSWDPSKYFNIWLGDLDILGIAEFPSDGINSKYGLVLDIGLFNIERMNPATLAHEIGHCFGLKHIWADDEELPHKCVLDDGIDDTPKQGLPNTNTCPSFPHVSCNNGPNGDMFMNFMDYTTSSCQGNFTPGQSERMRTHFIPGAELGTIIDNGIVCMSGDIYPPPIARLWIYKLYESRYSINTHTYDPHSGIDRVEYYINNSFYAVSYNYPFSIDWCTIGYNTGNVLVKIKAWDKSGNYTKDSINITLSQQNLIDVSYDDFTANKRNITLGESITLKGRVKNIGNQAVNGVQLVFKIFTTEGDIIIDTKDIAGVISPGGFSSYYTFSYTPKKNGLYNACIKTVHCSDANHLNDESNPAITIHVGLINNESFKMTKFVLNSNDPMNTHIYYSGPYTYNIGISQIDVINNKANVVWTRNNPGTICMSLGQEFISTLTAEKIDNDKLTIILDKINNNSSVDIYVCEPRDLLSLNPGTVILKQGEYQELQIIGQQAAKYSFSGKIFSQTSREEAKNFQDWFSILSNGNTLKIEADQEADGGESTILPVININNDEYLFKINLLVEEKRDISVKNILPSQNQIYTDTIGKEVVITTVIENKSNNTENSFIVSMTAENQSGLKDVQYLYIDVLKKNKSTTLTFRFMASLPDLYKITVKVHANDDIISNNIKHTYINIITPPLVAPVLINPSDNDSNQYLNLTFKWNYVIQASGYQLQVATDQGFNTIVFEEDSIQDTYFKLPCEALNCGAQYYWRVRSLNNVMEGPWSQTWTFSTRSDMCPILPPQLLAPINDIQWNGIGIIDFRWSKVVCAEKYWLQVSWYDDFSCLAYDNSEISDTLIGIPSTFHSHKFYYRVKSLNSFDTSLWSDADSFWMMAPKIFLYGIELSYPKNCANDIDHNPLFSFKPFDNFIVVPFAGKDSVKVLIPPNNTFDISGLYLNILDANFELIYQKMDTNFSLGSAYCTYNFSIDSCLLEYDKDYYWFVQYEIVCPPGMVCVWSGTIAISETWHFRTKPAPSAITLLSPNGHDINPVDTISQITWTSSNVSMVRIEYSVDTGNTWYLIADSFPAVPGSYNWLVPDEPTAYAMIKISNTEDCAVYDYSDSCFFLQGDSLLAFANPDTAICYGSAIQLLGSASGGTPPYRYFWSPAHSLQQTQGPHPIANPIASTIFYVTITDTTNQTAVDSVRIVVTSSGWIQQASGFKTLNRTLHYISTVDEDVVWGTVQSNVPEFIKTTDGGKTWKNDTIDGFAGYWMVNLFAFDSMIAWAPLYSINNQGGKIIKTTDGGQTWSQQNSATFLQPNGFPNSIHFWNSLEGICLGDPNGGFFEIYTTTDGGNNWNRVNSNSIPTPLANEFGWVNAICVAENNVFYFTTQGRLFKSIDKGHHWTVSILPVTATAEMDKVLFRDALNGVFCQQNTDTSVLAFDIFKTVDGGTNWQTVVDTGVMFARDICYVPGTEGTLISTGGRNIPPEKKGASYSHDFGKTWYKFPETDTNQFGVVDFVDQYTGYAGGYNVDSMGTMFKFTGLCNGPVEADFYADPLHICKGTTIYFYDNSIGNIFHRRWHFPGGTPEYSDDLNPYVTYDSAGSFDAILWVSNGMFFDSIVKAGYINVGDNLEVNGGPDQYVCIGSEITLYATAALGTQPYSFYWDNGHYGEVVTFTADQSDQLVVIAIDAKGCMGTDTLNIFVNHLPVVNNPAQGNGYCYFAGPTYLYGATPSGGFYTGNGVWGDYFDPYWSGPGNHDIVYHFIDTNGCEGTDTAIYHVFNPEYVTWNNPLDPQCITSTDYILTGGNPQGGEYFGVGVTYWNANFNASIAGTGTHTLTYIYYDYNGCPSHASNLIKVYDNPNVYFVDSFPPQWSNTNTYYLNYGIPWGGIYAGNYVEGKFFKPSLAGPGNHLIKYTYVDNIGCVDSTAQYITVLDDTAAFLSLGSFIGCDTFAIIPVTVTNFRNIGYFRFIFEYDTNSAIFESVMNENPLLDYTYYDVIDDSGKVIMEFSSFMPFDVEDGHMFDLRFINKHGITPIVKDSTSTSIAKTISGVAVNLIYSNGQIQPPLIQVDAGQDTLVCQGNTIQLKGYYDGCVGIKSIQWTPTIGLNNPHTLEPLANILGNVTYTLSITDEFGRSSSDLVNILTDQNGWITKASGFPTPGRGISFVHAPDEYSAWATGTPGMNLAGYLREFTTTSDGGKTWTAKNLTGFSSEYFLGNIFAFDSLYAWITLYSSSNGGKLAFTEDGGFSWIVPSDSIFVDTAAFPNFVTFWSDNEGITIGDPVKGEFEIYRTLDYGNSWCKVDGSKIPDPVYGEFGILNCFESYENHLYFPTTQGRVFVSSDRGDTWSVIDPPLNGYITEVIAIDTSTLIVGQNNSGSFSLFKTNNGGGSWQSITPNGNLLGHDIIRIPDTKVLLSTGGHQFSPAKGVTYSHDLGESWHWIPNTIDDYYMHGDFVSKTCGYVGGVSIDSTHGGIHKFTGVCNDELEANLISDKTVVCRGDSVLFANISTGSYFYQEWHFQGGNPSVSEDKYPVVKYDSAGRFDVVLIVHNSLCIDTIIMHDYITVNQTIDDTVKIIVGWWEGNPCFTKSSTYQIVNNQIDIYIQVTRSSNPCIQVMTYATDTTIIGQLQYGIYYVRVFIDNNLYNTDTINICTGPNTWVLSGFLNYSNTSNTPLAAIPITLNDSTGNVIKSVVTGSDGSFVFQNLQNNNYIISPSVTKPWGGVTAMDLTRFRQVIANIDTLTPMSPFHKKAGDVNLINGLTAIDLTMIRNRIAGITTSFQSGDWLYDSTEVVVQGANVNRNIYALCYGDGNGSYAPAAKADFAELLVPNGQVIQIQDPSHFVLPVNTLVDLAAASITMDITYPDDLFELLEVNLPQQNNELTYHQNGNKLRLVFSSLTPLYVNSGQTLVFLSFKTKSTLPVEVFDIISSIKAEFGDMLNQELHNIFLTAPQVSYGVVTSMDSGEKDELKVTIYPNPFTDQLNIDLELDRPGFVRIEISDITGREIEKVMERAYKTGPVFMTLNLEGFSDGVYFVSISHHDNMTIRRKVEKVIMIH